MDEREFLKGLEGEQQQGEDLVAGAEHFVRLKQQCGQQQSQYPDLELEKKAGFQPVKNFGKGLAFGVAAPLLDAAAVATDKGHRASSAGFLAGEAGLLGGSYALGKHHANKEKKAAATEALKKALINALTKVDPPLYATAALGAAAGGLGTYLGSRPQKDTGKSKMEEEMTQRATASDAAPNRGILSKMHNADVHHAKGYAEAFREHPGKAGLMGAAVGAGGGYLLGRLGGAAIRHFKKG